MSIYDAAAMGPLALPSSMGDGLLAEAFRGLPGVARPRRGQRCMGPCKVRLAMVRGHIGRAVKQKALKAEVASLRNLAQVFNQRQLRRGEH